MHRVKTDKLTIYSNFQERPLVYWRELTDEERKDFDYTDEDNFTGFRYKGQVYDLGEFTRCRGGVQHLAIFANAGWQGYASDSFFSGVLVAYTDEGVIVGWYVS